MITTVSRPRICHIVGDSRFGGGSKIITRLAAAGLEAGYDVEVLANDPAFVAYLERHGVNHVPGDYIWRPIRPHRDLMGAIRLWRFLKASRYDIVHTHTSKAGFVGRLAAKLAGVPAVVHTVHGFSFHEGSDPLTLKLFSALERAAAHWCHRIVTVSEFHRRWALDLGIGTAESVMAIPNGISEPTGISAESRQEVRAEFGLADEASLIISMGRLVDGKGLEDIVMAMSILRERGCGSARLLLPGTGSNAESLAEIVSGANLDDVVVMPGFRADVGALLAAADIVVLPSYREGLSIALLEAMAAGKSIIISDIGSNMEATGNGEAAIVVPCGDSHAIADAIVRLQSDRVAAVGIGRRARERWESLYSEERMVESYLHLYRELLNI